MHPSEYQTLEFVVVGKLLNTHANWQLLHCRNSAVSKLAKRLSLSAPQVYGFRVILHRRHKSTKIRTEFYF